MVRRRMTKKHHDEPVPRRRLDQPEAGRDLQFRRGQTLSGYRLSAAEESSRSKAHQLVRQRRSVGAVFSIVFAGMVLLALLLWQLIAQVGVSASSKQLVQAFDSKLYSATIDEYLGLHPAQRLRFALDEQSLSEFIAAKHPEVAKLALSEGATALAKSDFTITFRTPVAGWQINGTQQYVDDAGAVFEKNYYAAPKVQIIDESGARPEKGSTVVGKRLLGFLGKVVAGAGERGYIVSEALLPQGGTRQVEISFTNLPTRVKLNIDRGAGEQIEDVDRALKYLAGRGEQAEYIDVRVSGRAAYR